MTTFVRPAILTGLVLSLPVLAGDINLRPDKPNEFRFAPAEVRFVRMVILSSNGQPCIDELEVYAEGSAENLALASAGAQATASSCLSGYAIHQIAHLNDGKYGNGNSWIAAGDSGEWAQIELARPAKVSKVVFSRDRQGAYGDRMPQSFEIRVSADAKEWKTVARHGFTAALSLPNASLSKGQALTEDELLRHAFACEGHSFQAVDRTDPLTRVLQQTAAMLDRLASKGVDVSRERAELVALQQRQTALTPEAGAEQAQALFHAARLAKRQLMLRDPDLAPLENVLFVRRHPYTPSHNYSDFMDGHFNPGGGVCTLSIPRKDGRLEPGQARLTTLFDGRNGVARDAVPDFEAKKIYFAYRPKVQTDGVKGELNYWHLYSISADGSELKTLTDGPYHDYYPCVLPDDGLAFVSTRCRQRFLCWVPMSMVLFRMERGDEATIRPLSYANLSEWGPSVMRDGRIIWTRSEYLDKGADYGHTLWAIRPDGTNCELVYGNNSGYNLMNGREVPGSSEICATLISHFGDFNGPIALIDVSKGRFNPQSAQVITPDNTKTSNDGVFRDPLPIARDYVLISHKPSPQSSFGLYVIDRWGNREVLFLDPSIGSMSPMPLKAQPRPPVLPPTVTADWRSDTPGQLVVADVYQGLGPNVKRGSVKYIRVCEEVRSNLEPLPNGGLRETYPDFHGHYATPVDKINGPFGWPSYVAKSVVGIAPVNEDGSAYFEAPSGKTFYFQALDENYTEIQRMRSVMQLQPGEVRSCVGCHEDRVSTGLAKPPAAVRNAPAKLQPPPWGAGPFAYERIVQPVLNARCVSCHDGTKSKFDLRANLDGNKVPASYSSLIKGGWVHHFSMVWGTRHSKAEPLTFGTTKSKLFPVLADANHAEVKLKPEEMQALKCWIDLNCPLWPDYIHRSLRPAAADAANVTQK
jgi:hypothetical protein